MVHMWTESYYISSIMIGTKSSSPHVPYSKSLGAFLRERRLKANLSQGDVAKALKYGTSQVVSNWERGTQSPPFEKLLDLCQLLKISRKDMVNRLLDEQEKIYSQSLQALAKARRA